MSDDELIVVGLCQCEANDRLKNIEREDGKCTQCGRRVVGRPRNSEKRFRSKRMVYRVINGERKLIRLSEFRESICNCTTLPVEQIIHKKGCCIVCGRDVRKQIYNQVK